MTKKKSKIRFKDILPLIVGVVMGSLFGFFGTTFIDSKVPENAPMWQGLVIYGIWLVSIYIQIVIHEGGHLLFGLLSGYKFSSFRILSFMIAKIDGKLCFKRFKLLGTGGQCLMLPPEMKDGKIPVMLYNFGGSILNLITGIIAILLCIFAENYWIVTISAGFGAIGIIFALMNGIPFKTKEVNNDGYNALSLSKDKEALNAFCLQLKVNALQMEGRLKDMPEEWFEMPSDEAMKNPMVAAIGVFRSNYLLDKHCFEQAESDIEHLLSIESGLVGLHRNILICDLIYLKLILDRDFEQVDALFTDEIESFMKAMQSSTSILRTRYTYALLGEQSSENAEKYKNKFNSLKLYPSESDLESERELIKIAEEKAGF